MVLLDLGSALSIGAAGREHVSKPELKRLVPWMLGGFLIGVTVLLGAPDEQLRVALGVFATIVGIHSILNPVLQRTVSSLWAVPAGISGGAIGTIFGAGGPIYATYLSGRLRDNTEMRSTMSTLISISAFARAIVYAVSGLLLHVTIFLGMALLAPFAWLGLKIGQRIHVGLTQVQMRRDRRGADSERREPHPVAMPWRRPRPRSSPSSASVHRARVRVPRRRGTSHSPPRWACPAQRHQDAGDGDRRAEPLISPHSDRKVSTKLARQAGEADRALQARGRDTAFQVLMAGPRLPRAIAENLPRALSAGAQPHYINAGGAATCRHAAERVGAHAGARAC